MVVVVEVLYIYIYLISRALIDVNIAFDIDILYSRGESMMLRVIQYLGKPS